MPRSPDDLDQTLSDELLNSFIDHQITNEERREVLSLLKKDESLANRVCELQRIKEMTRLAYDDIPPSAHADTDFKQPKRLHPVAASVAIFSLGLLLGLGVMQLNPNAQMLTTTGAEQAQTRVLVHLTSDDVDAGLPDEAEHIARINRDVPLATGARDGHEMVVHREDAGLLGSGVDDDGAGARGEERRR